MIPLDRYPAEVFEDQQAATRALERIGFKKTGVYQKSANDR
jgi:RimJ/RimL family protein N-acetyltransferase